MDDDAIKWNKERREKQTIRNVRFEEWYEFEFGGITFKTPAR